MPIALSRRALLTAIAAAPVTLLPSHLTIDPRSRMPHRPRAPAQVNLFSTANVPLGITPSTLIAVLQRYVDDFVAPAWGTPARLSWSSGPQKNVLNLQLLDNCDDAGAIGYHDFSAGNDVTPYGQVGVVDAYEYEGCLTRSLSHELGEILVNPGLNNWAAFTSEDEPVVDSRLRWVEIADPVREYWFDIDGVKVSNFVYPAWFQPWNDGSQLDYLGLCKQPGEILVNGYQIVRDHEKTSSVGPTDQPVCSRVAAALRALPHTMLHSGPR